jgi:hypothetical protein
MESDPRWPGVPCESDGWPFATDIELFEVRRAIGQLVRTVTTMPKLADPKKFQTTNPVLLYLSAAHFLSQQVQDVIGDLVSEARARGSSWAEIGEALEVGDTAVQKRYGKRLSMERYLQLEYEAHVVYLMAKTAAGDAEEEQETLPEELEGSTPGDRIEYAFEIIRGTLSAHETLEEKLSQDELDPAEIWRLLTTRLSHLCGCVFPGVNGHWEIGLGGLVVSRLAATRFPGWWPPVLPGGRG